MIHFGYRGGPKIWKQIDEKVINTQTGLSNHLLPFPLSKSLDQFVTQNQPFLQSLCILVHISMSQLMKLHLLKYHSMQNC